MLTWTEPCPNCRARIIPAVYFGAKKCPVCGFVWSDGSRGIAVKCL